MTVPIALTDAQMQQVMTSGRQLPHALRNEYLQRVAEALRGKGDGHGAHGDGDLHRACVAAVRAIIQGGDLKPNTAGVRLDRKPAAEPLSAQRPGGILARRMSAAGGRRRNGTRVAVGF